MPIGKRASSYMDVKVGTIPGIWDSGFHAGMTEFYKSCVDTSALKKGLRFFK